MILGAGIYQVPLIKKVKELGYKAIVVSPMGNYPGLEIADHIVNSDTRDKDAVLAAAIEYDISGILTTGTDVAVPSIGFVVDKLNLPGTGFLAAQRSMDKSLMKQCLVNHGVKTAQYREVYSISDAKKEASAIGYPVMIKAIDSSGSRGVTKVANDDEVTDAFREALAVSKASSVIVEQFIDGYEVGAQALVSGDRVDKIFIHNDVVTEPPISVPIGHSLPVKLPKNVEEKCVEVINLAVKAIGLKNTVANVDLMVCGSEVYILEIGARMGATCLPENISIYNGVNIYEYLIGLAVGKPLTIDSDASKQPNAALLIRSEKSGVVESIEIPAHVQNHPMLIDLKLDVGKGEHVNAFKVGPDRLGHVIVISDTSSKAELLAQELVSAIEIIIK
ncbi:ATP-grasp domain-containing protein [Pseudoalteromonas shioyasakiensis]|uniref:ATP-grasp domain-containing protein n=1 Tax=Pseudoalteromonas shioyasakiensis TaxID=1190813 RepID=UPI001EFC3D3F|nr:ATP-grasp domain-containing protein [Pseudoalteromonas shioyasakiensis]MCG9736092.1 ATP-grasp domain-containing protein [Pseudoalteromonas shioyasakiensis]